VKVMALIYGNEAAWEALTPEEGKELDARHRAFAKLAGDRIVTGAELAPTRAATTVRVRDGQTVITDGPFAETKEVISGLYLVDAASEERAIELAQRIPTLSKMGGVIEIRPIVEA